MNPESNDGTCIKPMYIFGKYRVLLILKAVLIVLSETINILRKLQQQQKIRDAPEKFI